MWSAFTVRDGGTITWKGKEFVRVSWPNKHRAQFAGPVKTAAESERQGSSEARVVEAAKGDTRVRGRCSWVNRRCADGE